MPCPVFPHRTGLFLFFLRSDVRQIDGYAFLIFLPRSNPQHQIQAQLLYSFSILPDHLRLVLRHYIDQRIRAHVPRTFHPSIHPGILPALHDLHIEFKGLFHSLSLFFNTCLTSSLVVKFFGRKDEINERYPITADPGITWNLFSDAFSGFSGSEEAGPDIACVLNEVRHVFIETFGPNTVNAHPVLGVLPTNEDPQTQRTNAIIFLSSTGLYYNQHIYQFAHELCHFMIPKEVCESYRWLEESLCEAMSWYAMDRIYRSRDDRYLPQLRKLYPNMPNYIKERQKERISLDGVPLSAFIRTNLAYLQKGPYNRPMNKAIAYELYPLFSEDPELWKIIPVFHTLTDNMSLPDGLRHLSLSFGIEKYRCDQFMKRLLE